MTIELTIEKVRQLHNVETGFLYERGRAQDHPTAPVFEKVLLSPRTKDEIADAIMAVDRAGRDWERALRNLDSEMGAHYRQAVEIYNRK